MNNNLSLNISFGSSQVNHEQITHAETVNPSNLSAGGNIKIIATEGNVNLTSVKMSGTDITLDAAHNLNITAAAGTYQTNSQTQTSSSSLGVSFTNQRDGTADSLQKVKPAPPQTLHREPPVP